MKTFKQRTTTNKSNNENSNSTNNNNNSRNKSINILNNDTVTGRVNK